MARAPISLSLRFESWEEGLLSSSGIYQGSRSFTSFRISDKTGIVKMMATVGAQRMPFGDISNKENALGGLSLKKKAAAQEKELENFQEVTQLTEQACHGMNIETALLGSIYPSRAPFLSVPFLRL